MQAHHTSGAGGAVAPQFLAEQLTLFQPGFSDLATALNYVLFCSLRDVLSRFSLVCQVFFILYISGQIGSVAVMMKAALDVSVGVTTVAVETDGGFREGYHDGSQGCGGFHGGDRVGYRG
jgi:hypothetical protein